MIFTCKSCGVVWKKHSVTISWRQTCVSECLKEKRSCAERPLHRPPGDGLAARASAWPHAAALATVGMAERAECSRMLANELWITDKHVPGNGGMNLTPSPDEVLEAEKHGLLVGIFAKDDVLSSRVTD